MAGIGSLAFGIPWAGIATIGVSAYTANVLVERQTGRNILGHGIYAVSDVVIREVMDRALQAGVRPSSTQTFNGYTFSVDRYCRVYQVNGNVSRRNGGRTYDAVRPLVKATGDHSGHIIADSLNGPIAAYNFIGMTAYHNNAVGAGPDDDTYSRMEEGVRYILDSETKYVPGRGSLRYVRATISVRLTYPPWNATTRMTKLNYFRPNHLYVEVIAYTASGEKETFSNPFINNAIPGHMGVRSVQLNGNFNNTPAGANRYLIGDPGYP
jgi:hypothetical protein